MMLYDYQKNVAGPMDITGMNFQFRIFKLPEQVPICIHVTNSNTEIDVDFDIPLSEEQASYFVSLENDEQKLAFIKEIADSNQSIKNEIESRIEAEILVHMSKSI